MKQGAFAERGGLAATSYNQYDQGKNMLRIEAAHALCDTYPLTMDCLDRGDPSGLWYKIADSIRSHTKLRR